MNENKSDLDIDSSDIKLENLTTAMFEFNNLDQLYLATKSNYYRLNSRLILKLTDNLLFRNSVLNQEIEILYPNYELIEGSKADMESNELLDKCLENSIDHEFILKILWHHIYVEPIIMKFISMRYSNFASNLYNYNETKVLAAFQTDHKRKKSNDFVPIFHLI
jgi:hypothetical protein